MSEPMYISNEEALEAVRGAAWTEPADEKDTTCGHPGCTDHPGEGRLRIHTYGRMFGADWDLTGAEEFIRTAKRCAWVEHMMGHELGVIGADDRPIYFDVRRPAEVVLPDGLVSAQANDSPHDGEPDHGGCDA